MAHRESIPFEEYENNFDVPYIADFAKACQKYISLSGVKNCFVLEWPLFLPGETQPVQLLFQRKGEEEFECSDNSTIAQKILPILEQLTELLTNLGIECKNNRLTYTLYAEDNLKETLLKHIKLIHVHQEETSEDIYGIQFLRLQPLKIIRNFNGSFTIAVDNFNTCIAATEKLCELYEIERIDKQFAVTVPNIHTRYSLRRILDFFQFILIHSLFEE